MRSRWGRELGKPGDSRHSGHSRPRLAFKALTTRRSEFWDVSTVQPRHGQPPRWLPAISRPSTWI
jgi:hypothetical protein